MHASRDSLDQFGRIGVVFEGSDADDAAILHLGEKRAPMGMIANEARCHDACLIESGRKVAWQRHFGEPGFHDPATKLISTWRHCIIVRRSEIPASS
jgi:hypothetical protein